MTMLIFIALYGLILAFALRMACYQYLEKKPIALPVLAIIILAQLGFWAVSSHKAAILGYLESKSLPAAIYYVIAFDFLALTLLAVLLLFVQVFYTNLRRKKD